MRTRIILFEELGLPNGFQLSTRSKDPGQLRGRAAQGGGVLSLGARVQCHRAGKLGSLKVANHLTYSDKTGG